MRVLNNQDLINLFELGDLEALVASANVREMWDPSNSMPYLYSALALDMQGDRPRALRVLSERLRNNGFNPDLLRTLSQLILGHGAYYSELRLLEQAFGQFSESIFNDDEQLQFFRAQGNLFLGKIKDAEREMHSLSDRVVPPQYRESLSNGRSLKGDVATTKLDEFIQAVLVGDFYRAIDLFELALALVVPGTLSDAKMMRVIGRFEASAPVREVTSSFLDFVVEDMGPTDLSGRILESFLYNGEKHLLDLHLGCTEYLIDNYVIVDGDHSFTGKKKYSGSPRGLLSAEQSEKTSYIGLRFRDFDHVWLRYPWFVEALHRNAPQRVLFNRTQMEIAADTTFIYSDVDEILSPEFLDNVRTHRPSLLASRLREHKFFLNFQYFGRPADRAAGLPTFSVAVSSRLNRALDAQTLRNVLARDPQFVKNAWVDGGWHFSSVLGKSDLIAKYSSYSHVENVIRHRADDFYDFLLSTLRLPLDARKSAANELLSLGVDIEGYHAMPLVSPHYPDYLIKNLSQFDRFVLAPMDLTEAGAIISMLQRRTYS